MRLKIKKKLNIERLKYLNPSVVELKAHFAIGSSPTVFFGAVTNGIVRIVTCTIDQSIVKDTRAEEERTQG